MLNRKPVFPNAFYVIPVILSVLIIASSASAQVPPPANSCARTIRAEVVAIDQPFMLNRLGAAMPQGVIFALKRDVVKEGSSYRLRNYKRPRPIVLRANEGDCLEIEFSNWIDPPLLDSSNQPLTTTEISIHAQGMQLVKNISDDGYFAGVNNSSLVDRGKTQIYRIFAEREGTYLLYSTGDTATTGRQIAQGLFGAINVQPRSAEWYRSQVTRSDIDLATTGQTSDEQPIIKYDATYPADYDQKNNGATNRACAPILKMVDFKREAVLKDGKYSCVEDKTKLVTYHTDLTAVITGPQHGRFAGVNGPDREDPPCSQLADPARRVDPLFCTNPALPDRKQPYREITTIYHEVPTASQAFPIFSGSSPILNTTVAGKDGFAINYGTGGIGAEIYANRTGVGPMAKCVECKFEEFFLTSWAVGDPAMAVDNPANTNKTAQVAFFPDDPSNVYHAYMNDHVKFRILHGGTGITHVHHQHAHQWLQSPNSDNASYLDSQMISPGASYTLEMVYNGAGNRNKTAGDSIFHCHFYPHFAAGMWSMFRVHDVFERGTKICGSPGLTKEEQDLCLSGKLPNGAPVPGARALPDGEITAGTPIPALVPMPTLPMAPTPSQVFIQNGQVVYGTIRNPDPTGQNVKKNPGFPFFIPGVAGARPPHPPLDFAVQTNPETGNKEQLDGGLPRHVVTGGTVVNNQTTAFDWSKDFYVDCSENDNFKYIAACQNDKSKKIGNLTARQLPEEGTNVEKVAMKFFGDRCHQSFLPENGSPLNAVARLDMGGQGCVNQPVPVPPAANFITNGRAAQPGAPYADPAVDDQGKATGQKRIYKAAAIQLNLVLNRSVKWHYPQHRMLTLWEDVKPTFDYKFGEPNPPAPLFIRANTDRDFVEYWHTNLVPNYYLVDDFQVRTPTDIIGQHIHLVKFDVTSSDGAANGFNYEDGTFSPDEVQERYGAITNQGGQWTPCTNCAPLRPPQPPPSGICATSNSLPQCNKEWLGAQTTIQRWYVDPLRNDNRVDRTMRSVFTHDHFGPSTHQQAGLYAGLLTEPKDSVWRDPTTGKVMGGAGVKGRDDGGPTSWFTDVITPCVGDDISKCTDAKDSYREFALEFQDLRLAYNQLSKPAPSLNPSQGWRDLNNAINAPETPALISTGTITSTFIPGTAVTNYRNEPFPPRIGGGGQGSGDFSFVFDSTYLDNGDPYTPILRANVNDKVQIRALIGAHMVAHYFTINGLKWFAEAGTPTDPKAVNNSGYRSSQAMGLSEHFELLFNVPPSSITNSTRQCPEAFAQNAGYKGDCADYLYSTSYDDLSLSNGMWGLIRTYDPTKANNPLLPLPKASNPIGVGTTLPAYSACPADRIKRKVAITAVTAQQALASLSPVPGQNAGMIPLNSRGADTSSGKTTIGMPLGIMYVYSGDLDNPSSPGSAKLKPGTPIEPLILRAAAGDCIEVTLTNGLSPGSAIFNTGFQLRSPFPAGSSYFASQQIGLSPQLLSFDVATSSGLNAGYNNAGKKPQTVPFNQSITYTWYAGDVSLSSTGKLIYTPLELGSSLLFPSDPLLQHINGLFGGMVVEPAGTTWKCDKDGRPTANCEPPQPNQTIAYAPPSTRAQATVSYNTPGKTAFREFVTMISDEMQASLITVPSGGGAATVSALSAYGAINYKTEPGLYRFNTTTLQGCDSACYMSNALVNGDPQTPIFTATAGTPVRFRMIHPPGTGVSQVFTLSGHVWQRNPYKTVNNVSSKEIGDNRQSQWIGSRDNHGATDHFDLIVDQAGGRMRVPGDYVYTVFLADQAVTGGWGIFRVLTPQGRTVRGTPVCPQPQCGGGTPPADPAGARTDLDRFRPSGIVKSAGKN